MASDRIKVLYIACKGRSGSTILGNILGQIPGYFHVGELHCIWHSLLVYNNWLCGCGIPLRECALWNQILQEAFGSLDSAVSEMVRLENKFFRTYHLPWLLLPGTKVLLKHQFNTVTANIEKLYFSIRDTVGCRIIVDSSKVPSPAYFLMKIPSVEVYMVHLVRDPRATRYSWQRRKYDPTIGALMDPPRQLALEALTWDFNNLVSSYIFAKQCAGYLRFRYEDFISKPKESIETIMDMIGEGRHALPFMTEQRVELSVNHTVSGNPDRFKKGAVDLAVDQEWKSKMKWSDRFMVTALTWPLLLYYKYPILRG